MYEEAARLRSVQPCSHFNHRGLRSSFLKTSLRQDELVLIMYSHLILGASLISQGLAAVVAHSPSDSATPAHITPGPQVELLRKQNNDRFMGYVELTPNTWTSLTCASGNTVYQTGDYWACCATTRTGCLPQSMPIACVAGNMVFRAATTGSVSLTNSLVTKPWYVSIAKL
jgi:hypothetical protein